MKIFKILLLFFICFNVYAESSCDAYRPLHVAYNLTGPHALSMCTCSSCHLGGVWKGTPNTCIGCHTGSRGTAIGKPTNHIPTALNCSACHIGIVFVGGQVDHNTLVTPGTCLTCHTGNYAGTRGKPSDHPATTASCDACHSTRNWSGASFNHVGVVKGSCNTCHTVPRGHILTGGLSCDVCHNRGYSTFSGGTYIHSGSEQCEGCHSPTTTGVTTKPANHPATPNNCGSCHSITGWPCKSGQLMKQVLDSFLANITK